MTDLLGFAFSGEATAKADLDLRCYRLGAVKEAAYRLADRCTAFIGAPEEGRLPIRLTFKPGTTEALAAETVRLFMKELLDQELREHDVIERR
ncbi:hypothetical protein BH09MYX1_BH09MYX1_49080 [soil metagenome]